MVFAWSLRDLQKTVHEVSSRAGWWNPRAAEGAPFRWSVDTRVPEKLCLIHSEISEALEGHRQNLQDCDLPNRHKMEVELADAIIRILDLAEACKFDMQATILEKIEFNKNRLDHRIEHRDLAQGKRY